MAYLLSSLSSLCVWKPPRPPKKIERWMKPSSCLLSWVSGEEDGERQALLAPIPTAKITYPNKDDCLDKSVTLTLPTHTSKKVNEVLGQDMKRERMQKRRENSQGRQNNNSLSIKQNQGWLFPP